MENRAQQSFAKKFARCTREVSMASTADDTESAGIFLCPAEVTAFSEPMAVGFTNRASHDVEKGAA